MAVEQLTAIGWGLVVFAIVIGLGLVVLQKLSAGIACPLTFATFNNTVTPYICQNSTLDNITAGGTGYTTVNYVATQMGSTGLAGWIPVIIVVLIAGLVLALFGGKKPY